MMRRRKLPDVKLPFSETKHPTMNSTSVDSHLDFVLIPLQSSHFIIVIFVTLLSINQLHHRKCLTRIFTFTPVTSRTSLKEKLLQNTFGFQNTINCPFSLARLFVCSARISCQKYTQIIRCIRALQKPIYEDQFLGSTIFPLWNKGCIDK